MQSSFQGMHSPPENVPKRRLLPHTNSGAGILGELCHTAKSTSCRLERWRRSMVKPQVYYHFAQGWKSDSDVVVHPDPVLEASGTGSGGLYGGRPEQVGSSGGRAEEERGARGPRGCRWTAPGRAAEQRAGCGAQPGRA